MLGGSRGIGSLVRYFVANEVKWCELISIGSWLAPSLASLSTSSLPKMLFCAQTFWIVVLCVECWILKIIVVIMSLFGWLC